MSSAIVRLHRDWKELEQEKEFLSTIAALPTSNILVWHCNLRPDYGPFAGTIFHLILKFPENYPHSPPDVELCTYLNHPNVFGGWREEGYTLCLDMIKEYYTDVPYTGWTSAYSILSLLLQLQSFLFAENIPQDWGGHAKASKNKKSTHKAISATRDFKYEIETHDGIWITHTHTNPWPPLPKNTAKRPLKPKAKPFQFRIQDFPSLGSEATTEDPVEIETLTIAHQEVPGLVEKEHPPQDRRPSRPVPPSLAPQLPSHADLLPSAVYTKIFSYLGAKEILKARDVCSHWRRVVVTYNLFERTQIVCFHSKATLDDDGTTLGIGLQVDYYPDGKALKAASSPLDLLSLQAFDEEGIRTGVWGGRSEAFDHFLPLIFNDGHAAKAFQKIEETVYRIMKRCAFPILDGQRKHSRRNQIQHQHFNKFHPYMIFQLLATLMNSMVVELMNSAEQSRGGEIQRHASEKALEGYCAFHHMLLYFAKRYPVLIEYADKQVYQFLSSEEFRCKRRTPNLGILLICLTLSRVGWAQRLRRPLVMEAFDRNVRWLLQKHPKLSRASLLTSDKRLECTFTGARTSLRLMMFQVYFLSCIGRPPSAKGPFDVLDRYEKRMGKPTTAQKEDLQRNAKEILAVTTWPQFFQRLRGPVPSKNRLVEILVQAVKNSERKGYHYY